MTGEADQLAAMIAFGESRHLDALIQAANDGDKRAAKELHRHIRWEIASRLDDRLADYVAAHGLPAKGKETDTGTRDLALSFAVAIRRQGGEAWQEAVDAVAALAHLSVKSVEAAFKGDTRETAEAWANDPDKRAVMVAIAAPYLT